MARNRALNEYRILGKNGGECFRSRDYKETVEKINSLREKKPRVNFIMQYRWCRYEGYELRREWNGDLAWTIWYNSAS